jgi:polar amino acid transport system ATP-binding protein
MVVTHEMGFAREVATTMAFVHEGNIVEKGSPASVIANPQHAQTKRFLEAVL